MKELIQMAQAGLTIAGGVLGYILGPVNGLVITLVLFICMDYISGVLCGIVDRKLSSEIGFKGIAKKVAILMLVGMGNFLDMYVLKQGAVIRTAVILFYLSNEGLSILENSAHLGLPVPTKLKTILVQLKENKDEKKELKK